MNLTDVFMISGQIPKHESAMRNYSSFSRQNAWKFRENKEKTICGELWSPTSWKRMIFKIGDHNLHNIRYEAGVDHRKEPASNPTENIEEKGKERNLD